MKKKKLSRSAYRSIAVVISASFCSTGHVIDSTATPITRASVSQTISTLEWMPRMSDGVIQYTIEDSSTISMNNDSLHASRLQSRAVYRLSFSSHADTFAVGVKIDSFMTTQHSSSMKSREDTTHKQNFQAKMLSTGHLLEITGIETSSCITGVDPLGSRILELMVAYPKRAVRVGDKWVDTVSTTTCRGKTPLMQQNVRQYELLELQNSATDGEVKVRREVTTTLTTSSSGAKDHFSASGSGSSSATLYLDRLTGILVRSEGNSQSTLTVNTSRGSYPFSQRITTSIERK